MGNGFTMEMIVRGRRSEFEHQASRYHRRTRAAAQPSGRGGLHPLTWLTSRRLRPAARRPASPTMRMLGADGR
jgi:hypothetical protein